ncbi:unnamed protein product [Ranitomeya imitator]|uniref:Reverse transcriptase domain-containing protein n=1 Tax=Ranitomeya imitator TaxID=111125 RepID=A0ABN9LUR6_9NEOB|nr:unnamed protein product [Ranitomeya imitator]
MAAITELCILLPFDHWIAGRKSSACLVSEDGERIIREVETNATFLSTPSLHDLKLKYENTLKKSTTLQLHLIALSEYYKAKKIPRGLRSNIRPNLMTNDSLFCARFSMISNKYGLDIILLNIEYLQQELKKVDLDIPVLESEIKSLLREDEWTSFRELLKTKFDKLRLELEEVSLRKKSNFIPLVNSPVIEAFISAVSVDIEKLKNGCPKRFEPPNMTVGEMEALCELAQNEEIIIKKADKGGAVVVLDRTEYIEEIKGQLEDPGVYERLSHDPKFDIAREIKTILENAVHKQIIDQDLYDFLTIKFPVTPVIYTLPKIHKSLVHPLGRPIVSGCGSIFSNIGIFLDKILNPIAGCAESFVRDTTDFLEKISGIEVFGEVILASFDVTSLYTLIDHAQGLAAVNKKLLTTHHSSEARSFVIQLLELVLTRNHFLFGDTFNLQLRGTAMGVNMAPAYANIVMNVIEEDFVYVSHHFGQVAAWWRYIDDVFLVWTGRVESLLTFHGC